MSRASLAFAALALGPAYISLALAIAKLGGFAIPWVMVFWPVLATLAVVAGLMVCAFVVWVAVMGLERLSR